MATRNIVMTDHQEQLVSNLVKTGRYQNASEVLREGLRLVEEKEVQLQQKLLELRGALAEGLQTSIMAAQSHWAPVKRSQTT